MSQLPARESVLWVGAPGIGPAPAEDGSLSPPPLDIITSVQEHCQGLGLVLEIIEE